MLWACRLAILKLNKDKCLFICTSLPFSGEVVSRQRVSPDLRKIQVLTDMPPPKSRKELQSFLGILNYLSNFSQVTVEVCEPLQKLTSVKAGWMLHGMYQDQYDRANKLVWNSVIHLEPYIRKLMHQMLTLEPDYYSKGWHELWK